MDITIFLSMLWGPVLLAMGIGFFVSRSYYVRVYRDLEKETLAALLFGMVMMTAGIAQVLFHNAWNTLPAILVSIIGWGMIAKGAVFIIAPKVVDDAGNRWAKLKLIPVAGTAVLLIGAYLTWFAYFA